MSQKKDLKSCAKIVEEARICIERLTNEIATVIEDARNRRDRHVFWPGDLRVALGQIAAKRKAIKEQTRRIEAAVEAIVTAAEQELSGGINHSGGRVL